MENESPTKVRAVEHTFTILEELVSRNGASLAELAAAVDLSKSTIHNHLATLEALGYVDRVDSEFQIGLRCLRLGGFARDSLSFFVPGRPVVDSIADQTDEFVALTTEHRFKSVHVYRAEGANALPSDSYLGVHLDLHCSASGKAMLAHMDEERVETYLEAENLHAWTENTITDRSALEEELSQIRQRGISFEEEERIQGLRAIAMPVLRREDGKPLCTLAIAGPASRLKGEMFRSELPDLLRRHAEMLEITVAYS